MTSAVLVRTCFVSACANALFNKRDRNPLDFHTAAVVARRTTRSTALSYRYRFRRHSLASPAGLGRRRRTPWSAYRHEILRKPSHSLHLPRLGTTRAGIARRVLLDTEAMDEMVLLQRSLDQPTRSGTSTPEARRHQSRGGSRDESKPRRFPEEPLASPPSHVDDLIETRSARSGSTASRSTNRLSLTLPIVPPAAYPSRPTPASSTTPAFPPTPLDTPSLMSPADPNDFITAIAAQERRVLELREELNRAELDLARLKKQYATHEAYKKRGGRRNIEPIPGLAPAAELHDEIAIRRSIELDRRKALLGQQNQQATPERSRRRVFTGSHTRTLSLLSPTKPSGGFEDEPESSRIDTNGRFVSATSAVPAKRASWTSRPTQASGMKQLAEDLKTGIWTFVEDLRQATVGDEPITGQGLYMRGMDGNMRPTMTGGLHNGGNQDTIRTRGNPRARASSAFEETSRVTKQEKAKEAGKEEEDTSSDAAPPKPPRPLQRSKTDAGTSKPTKRFSWTPLTIDSYDDNDWSNWDSPNISSPRWSGTTVNGDIIPTIPEKRDNESELTPLKEKSSKDFRITRSPSPSSSSSLSPSNKLEELLPPVLNKLTPSNIKRAAGDFMKEWERSLSPPDMATPVAVGHDAGKEKGA
ncbi:hypothetical protein C8A03DRAFT_14462 [Achaetomium macrosporum]|uniref:DUF4048 domain-containing protein n=1 Tax=Achaetomium macrosporum TaxID=79813 RepID=A0AAN7HEP0_9PEZI|nr:hypothetical protein C8A03DRAFT_14462 [Achaetomium macrosporum]